MRAWKSVVALVVVPAAALCLHTTPATDVTRRNVLAETTGAAVFFAAGAPAWAADEAETPPERPARREGIFAYDVPLRGKEVPLSKFRGTCHLVVNVKMDDPVAGSNFAALKSATAKYAKRGLRIWAFPTDQGYYEPDVAELIRYKAYNQFGFGQYPAAVVFDKIDVVGKTAHPLYAALCEAQKNPFGLNRLALNFEKFLLDADGNVLRRYPRKMTTYDFDDDLAAAVDQQQLPKPDADFVRAWKEAARDAQRGEYSFRSNYNVYDQSDASIDWEGLAELSFQ